MRGRGNAFSRSRSAFKGKEAEKRGQSADPATLKKPEPEPPKPDPPQPEPPQPPKEERTRKNSTDRLKTVVQTKVASLNAFKKSLKRVEELKAMKEDQQKAIALLRCELEAPSSGILKKSAETLSGSTESRNVTFSALPAKWRNSQNSVRRSEPDLRAIENQSSSQGSSFDSTRSMSDESLATSSLSTPVAVPIKAPTPPPSPAEDEPPARKAFDSERGNFSFRTHHFLD